MTKASFSCDLIPEAKKHVAFLQRLHNNGITTMSERDAKEAIRRYTHLWLPWMAAESVLQDGSWIPPADVAWMWHCHRLAPFDYESYCQRRFGRIIEPLPTFSYQAPSVYPLEAEASTRAAWYSRYGEQEPFFLSGAADDGDAHEHKVDDSAASSNSKSKNSHILQGFDLLASADRQKSFLWQVSGAKFADETFLQQGVENYAKFLELSAVPGRTKGALVPTYQVRVNGNLLLLDRVDAKGLPHTSCIICAID
jgi:hypothetical protein